MTAFKTVLSLRQGNTKKANRKVHSARSGKIVAQGLRIFMQETTGGA